MKIEELNSCFDAISPTAEQRDKMFANIMNAKQQPVKVVRFYRYATAVAAVFVIGIFGIVYSTMGVDDVMDNATKSMVALENGEDNSTNVEQYEYLLETVEEEKSFTEEVKKEYSVHNDALNDTMVAVVQNADDEQITEDLTTDYTPIVASENEADAVSASGGGGGSSYAKSVEAETISLEQIMTHDVYSKLFPTQIVDDFKLVSASISDNDLNTAFEDSQGRYMSVSIICAENNDGYECVEVSDIVDLKPQYGYFYFTLNCGEHYVIYNVECEDALQVYEMVKSTEYFKN